MACTSLSLSAQLGQPTTPVLALALLSAWLVAYSVDLFLHLRWIYHERRRRWSVTLLRAWKLALAVALVASEVAWLQAQDDDEGSTPAPLVPRSPVYWFGKDVALILLALASPLSLPDALFARTDDRTVRRDLESANRSEFSLLSPTFAGGMRPAVSRSSRATDDTESLFAAPDKDMDEAGDSK
ncbi:hypothetical protein H9P43_002776 [Blastocladiella emersonii ATCC 22665]|nr:hypothetical protein H9P43_002776 [Blastocladiella emersonii ATCC 22665]